MNRFVVFFILTSVAAFAEVRVKGKIDSVIVFSDRALVKRVQPLEGLEKTGTLRFIDLPQALLGDSVRASATGATVTAVSLRKIEKLYGEEWDEHPLKKKIIRFEADIHHEKDNLETYRDQLKVLDQMMKLTTAQTDKEARVGVLNIDSWDKALVFLDAKKQRYREKIRKSEDVLQTLHKELSKTTIEFNAVTQAAKTSGIEVEVSYAKTDETAKIELEYLVNNVSWIARYDLRGSAEGNEFQLVSHAIIRQSTGEAWKQAKITLSTARPSTSMTPGILTPWRVDAHEFSSPTAKKQSSGRRLEGESTTIADEAMAETASESTDASETTSVSITLPTRENILSDNADHRVTLGTSALKGTLTHVAVPSLSQYVYLKARLKNMSSAPMVGTMNAFLDGSY
ncbi:MAG TPA: mucoidy inhibitor MuiA family protein, partial [Turneriella sp.]|nr:mucoidy inhibitor MuiA family protein [Turneriella sp.]